MPMAYRFDGMEKAGKGQVAKFSMVADLQPDDQNPGNATRQVSGAALITPGNGLLRRLNLKSSSKMEGERDGQSFSFSRKSSVNIRRTRIDAKKQPAKNKPKETDGQKKKDAPPAKEMSATALISGSQKGQKLGAFPVLDAKTGKSLCYI